MGKYLYLPTTEFSEILKSGTKEVQYHWVSKLSQTQKWLLKVKCNPHKLCTTCILLPIPLSHLLAHFALHRCLFLPSNTSDPYLNTLTRPYFSCLVTFMWPIPFLIQFSTSIHPASTSITGPALPSFLIFCNCLSAVLLHVCVLINDKTYTFGYIFGLSSVVVNINFDWTVYFVTYCTRYLLLSVSSFLPCQNWSQQSHAHSQLYHILVSWSSSFKMDEL